MTENYEYECALSGLIAPGGVPFEGDGLDDLPAGWTEVRMSRRVMNPKWVLIQQVKQAMVEGLKTQFPEAVQDAQAVAIRLQVDAQFWGLEQETSTYITEMETVYLAPPEMSEDVAASVNEARELLGLSAFFYEEEEEDDQDPDSLPSEHKKEAK
tara:strand:- start:2143 stop:2607 length:465 start_codon:yes stop_codon:yes gene_type:complete